MTYYPIYIPTLNRFNHFKECVKSLAKCTHADKTELVIGLDYPPSEKYEEGHNQIKKYIPTINGFKKVTIFEHKENIGAIANWTMLKEYCFEHYDAAIGTEDDNIFSPCFLDYMNQGLERFKYDEKIVSISGYNHEECYNVTEQSAFRSFDNCAWGIGFWRTKENKIQQTIQNQNYYKELLKSKIKCKKILSAYPNLAKMLLTMVKQELSWGDVKRTAFNILTKHYQIKPTLSLVKNMGYDGSGIHCGTNDKISKQIISKEKIFVFPKKIEYSQSINKKNGLFYLGLPNDIVSQKQKIEQIKNEIEIYRNPKLYSFKTQLMTKIEHLKMAITHPRYIAGWILRKLKIKK